MATRWRREQIERRRQLRTRYAEDILRLVAPELKKPLSESRMLDLGCGLGTNTIPAAKMVRSILAVDIDRESLAFAKAWAERECLDNIEFREVSATELNEADAFDIVLCDYLLEHIPDHDSAIRAIAQHLALNGAYYLSTNNRWWPLEGHYGLPVPLVSWMPKKWSDRYVRLLRLDQEYSIHPPSLALLTSLLSRHGLTWKLKPPIRPYTIAQRIGKRLVSIAPAFWYVANVFQVVGRRRTSPRN